MAFQSATSSFTRKGATPSLLPSPCCKPGPHGTFLISSGFSDLDKIIGGGFPVGSVIMVMEDINAPHHLLLLRYFMAQGLVHGQPLLFGSTTSSSQAFLGTLPGLSKSKENLHDTTVTDFKGSESEGLRIAWQYRKFIDEQQSLEDRRAQQQKLMLESRGGAKLDYCSSFDIKRPVERSLFTSGNVECINLQVDTPLSELRDKCRGFCSKLSRDKQQIGRLALQSLCCPQGLYFDKDWEMLGFLQSLKGQVRASNSVAMVTFPASLLSPNFSVRWQHMADVLLAIEAVPDDDKGMMSLITDYNDIIGFLRILKLPCINTQVPIIPESGIYGLKFSRRKMISLEKLNQAPIDASDPDSGSKTASSLLCSGPQNVASAIDF